jgi:hypothetical protein
MKYTVAKSNIEGKGLFAKQSYQKGEIIGLSHLDGKPTNVIGKYHNHSDEPTAVNIKKGNQRFLIANKDIPAGVEITTNYRKQPELEQPEDFKKGGKVSDKKYSKSLSARNRLFTENPLHKKHKNKIYNPNAKYYQEGGESEPQVECTDDGRCYETDQAQELLDKTHRDIRKSLDIDSRMAEQVWNNNLPANKEWQKLGVRTADQIAGDPNAFACANSATRSYEVCNPSAISDTDTLSNARMKSAVAAGRTPFRKVASYPNNNFLSGDDLKPGQLISFMGNGVNHMIKYYGDNFNDDQRAFMQSNGSPQDWSFMTHYDWLPNVPATVYEYAPYYNQIQALEEKARTSPTMIKEAVEPMVALPIRPAQTIELSNSNNEIIDNTTAAVIPSRRLKGKMGGALLTKKVTCKKCGWAWDAADGGDDVTTCHKCGGQGLVHAQDGGSFYTVPGSDGVYKKVNGKWQVDWNRSGNFQPLSQGDVAKRTAVLNKQAKPLYNADYDSLVASRKYESAPAKAAAKPQTATQKKAQQNFNQNFKVSAKDDYTKVQDKIKRDQQNLIEWAATNNVPITQKEIDDVENWGWNIYGKVGVQGRPDQINSYTPDAPQGFLDKAADIVSNPMTSAGYFMRGQDIPDYMQRDMDRGTFGYYANGDLHTERNPLDFVSDFTPLGLVNDTRNVVKGIGEGDLGKIGLGLAGAIPGFTELRSASKAAKVLDKFGNASKVVSELDDPLVDLWRIQERNGKTFAQLAEEGKLHPLFNNPSALAKKAEEEKYFGQWFTKDKNDFDFYRADREFKDPEIINLKVPKSKLEQYSQYDKSLSRAPDREFIVPFEEQELYKQVLDNAVKAGFDGNFITRPLTLFGKNELTPGNQWYRKIGNEAGLRDLINKQGAQAPAPMRMRSGITLDAPFFGKGTAPNENYKGLFAVEVKPEAASKYNWRSRVAGVDNYGSVPFKNDMVLQNMPLEDLNVYKKKWFSNNYKKLDPNNLEQSLMNAPVQRTLENAYKWGVRGYLGKSAYDYMNQPEKENKELYDEYQQGGESNNFIKLDLSSEEIQKYVQGGFIVEDVSIPLLNQ